MDGFCINEAIKPNNLNALGVLGYLIVLNNQVHSYELNALENYLNSIELKLEDTCLDAIIKGTEDSVSYATVSDAFSHEENDVKIGMLYQMYVLSYVDNHFAESEEEYIDCLQKKIVLNDEILTSIKENAQIEARTIRSNNNTIFRREIEDKKGSIWKRIVAWFVWLFSRIFRKDVPVQGDSDKEYKDTIEKCAEIAREDLSVVEPAYNREIINCRNTIESIRAYKKGLSLETGVSANVAKTIDSFLDMLNSEVVEHTNRALESLAQKKSTISDFTISLIGRTKAGKSTLHAILTQQGKERIGVGKQRTTRYNWVYQWNLLRIIDTPGVGSAEADGRKDEEIAESVLGESDIICFVVADDSILKDVLEFIEKIALLNKPIIILLNHKENIRPDVKFRRYLADPTQWLTEDGESSLKGHENRIRKYAENKGFGNLLNIYPVFLLPALMSEEEKYKEYKDILWNSSHVEFFINEISTWILNSGQIKRSQTILDESINVFRQAKESIIRSERIIDDQIAFLSSEKINRLGQLHIALDDVLVDIRSVLENKFDELATNEALIFAEEYVASGSSDGEKIGEKWTAFLEKIEFESSVKNDIDSIIMSYRDLIDRTISSLFEDLYYSVNMSMTFNNVDIPIQFDFRNVARYTSATLALAGSIVCLVIGASNPVGWILSAIGFIGGLIAQLFTSKEKKRQEAIDKIYLSVNESVKKEAPDQIDRIIEQIGKELSDNLNSIEDIYNDLTSGMKWIKQTTESLITSYSTEIDQMNKAYAWRITQFLDATNDNLDLETIDREIIKVDRSPMGSIYIETNSLHNENTEALKTVLAEDIIIKRGNQ